MPGSRPFKKSAFNSRKRNQFWSIFEHAPIGIAFADNSGDLLNVNSSLTNLLGYSKQELLKMNFRDFSNPEDLEKELHLMQKLQSSAIEDFQIEKRYLTKSGSPVWVELTVTGIRGENDKLTHFIGMITDITGRKQVTEELRESEERLRLAMESARAGIWEWNLVNGEVKWDQGALNMLGYTKEKFDTEEKKVLDLIHPEEKSTILRNARSYIEGKIPDYNVEFRLLNSQGEYQWIWSVGRIMKRDRNGNPLLFTGIHRDITERKEMEQEKDRAHSGLKKIEWLLDGNKPTDSHYEPWYEDLTELNTSGLILHSLGTDILKEISEDYLGLLESSGAIYERNGDYALGLFASNWCRFMDSASRNLCGTSNNREALESGKWLCHESCWKDASLPSIEQGEPVDIPCNGGIRLYAVPIKSSRGIIGSINFGYGDPPTDPEEIKKLAKLYQVDENQLTEEARLYETRPPYIIALAKKRLSFSARLIGEMVDRKLAQREVDHHREELENLSQKLITLQEEERKKIARELHDEMGQELIALSMQFESLKNKLKSRMSDYEKKQLSDTIELVRNMSGHLREMIMNLRPSMLDHLGLIPTIRWFAERLMLAGSPKIILDIDDLKERPDPAIETTLFRVIQESLTNVLKHADAEKIQISIKPLGQLVRVIVEDNGRGFEVRRVYIDSGRQDQMGLIGMRERMNTIKGKLEIDSAPGRGTRVKISAPLEA